MRGIGYGSREALTYKLHRSVVVTSNRVVQNWGAYLGDNTMSITILDRLMHHCHLLEFDGRSYRLKEAAETLARKSKNLFLLHTQDRQIEARPSLKNELAFHSARADKRYVIVRGVSDLNANPERFARGWLTGGATTRPRSKKLLAGSTPTAKCRPDQGS